MDDANLQPTEEELRIAGEKQKARIIERTKSGIDVRGRPFVPYSAKGPWYYYPAGPNRSAISRKRAVRRMRGLIGGRITSTGLGIRFEGGYAEFKRRLGRGPAVDLTGPRAPHMMQSMVVWVRNNEIHIGFWDPEKAKLAAAHNAGAKTGRNHKVRLPKREFFGVSKEDRAAIRRDVSQMIRERMRRM